jgi:hypothetical protein
MRQPTSDRAVPESCRETTEASLAKSAKTQHFRWLRRKQTLRRVGAVWHIAFSGFQLRPTFALFPRATNFTGSRLFSSSTLENLFPSYHDIAIDCNLS